MPTIDQLAPATAAADTDAILVSQNGTARKITRAQVLSGVQPALAIPSGSLLGRVSAGVGKPETISIGGNLSLVGSTLVAAATPFSVSALPAGTVPAATDIVPLGQNSTNASVTYSQFMSGLAGVPNVNASQAVVTPTGSTASVKLADLASSVLPIAGGTMTGPLLLSGVPTTNGQAATKGYVDTQVATSLLKSGGTLSGTLSLATDPVGPLQAATKAYVDTQVSTAFPRSGGTISGPLVLPADPATGLQAATKQYVDTRVLRNGDTLTGTLVLAADPIAPLHAATKGYIDTQIGTSLLKSGGTLTGALTLSSDPAGALQPATKQYTDARVLRNGDTLTGALVLAADPITLLQATTKQYVDTQVAAALPKAGGAMTGVLTLSADPTAVTQAATKRYVDNQVTTALPLSGGTITGALILSGAPIAPLGAATKQYVDTTAVGTGVINVKASPYNAQLNGVTDDTAAFKAAYIAAPAGSTIYVPFGVTLLQAPATWGVSLTKRVKWIVDGTTLVDGTPLASAIPSGTNPVAFTLPGLVVGNTAAGAGAEVSLAGSFSTDFAVQHSSYIVNHVGGGVGSVIANARTDTLIYNSPNNYVWGGLDRLVWTGLQTPSASTPAQHVGRYVQSIRQTIGTNSSGAPLPQPQIWAACLEMRDTTGQPSSMSNATLTVEMDFVANGLDDGNNRQIQSLVVQQNDPNGAPVEVGTIIGVYLAVGSSGRTKNVFNVGIPFNNAVLNTTYATQLAGGSAIRLAAGHTISFEASGNNYLVYDSGTGTLRWNQGSLSYVVGKGITVGWQYVAAGNATLPNYIAGDIVFLTGSGTYTIGLPAANTVPAGVGFTFSNVGAATVTIAPAGSDVIDNGPIILRPNDRYHIVADGLNAWREIFRTNSVSPRFTGPPVLPSYTVATLPAAPGTGAKAFVTNGRKPAETAGAGTGVEVFYDGLRWISVCSGSLVVS